METRRFEVFCASSGRGNPALVVMHAESWSLAERQEFATRSGAPVCAFVDAVEGGRPPPLGLPYRHGPRAYCGHGILAAGACLASTDGEIEVLAGTGPVKLRRYGDRLYAVSSVPVEIRAAPAVADLLAVLGIRSPAEIGNTSVVVGSIGSPKWIVNVPDEASLESIVPDYVALENLSRVNGVNGVFACCPANRPEADLVARAFNPLGGVLEDAATGTGAGPAAWHWRSGRPGRTRILQGLSMEAPCWIDVDIEEKSVSIGGRVLPSTGGG